MVLGIRFLFRYRSCAADGTEIVCKVKGEPHEPGNPQDRVPKCPHEGDDWFYEPMKTILTG